MIEKPRVLRIHNIPFRVHLLPMAMIPLGKEQQEQEEIQSRSREYLLSFTNYEKRVKFQRADISPRNDDLDVQDFVKFFDDIIDRNGVLNYRFCNLMENKEETQSMEFHIDSTVALELKFGAQMWLRLDRMHDMDDRFEMSLEYAIQQDKRIEQDLRQEIRLLRGEMESFRLAMQDVERIDQQQIASQIKQHLQNALSSAVNENIEQLQSSFEERIQEMEQKNQANKNEVTVQINDVRRSTETHSTLIAEINKFKEEIQEERKVEMMRFADSSIVGNNESFRKQLRDWVGKATVQSSLLYRGSAHGYGAAHFHQRCDGQGPTLTIVKSTGGFIFGGYSDISWDSSSGAYKASTGCWLFALSSQASGESPLKLPLLGTGNENAIVCNASYGPIFGSGHDLLIVNASNSGNNTTNVGTTYTNNGNAHLFVGAGNFQVAEIEVYKV